MSTLRLAGILLLAAGCPVEEEEEIAPYEAVCTEPEAIPCPDTIETDLELHDAVSSGSVVSVVEGNDWLVDVDATAGGLIDAPDNPWLYLRFTDAGAEKLDLTDLEALDSMDWHMALKRFKLRLNGGPGGPSCVSAAAFPSASYGDLTPDDAAGATFVEDAFYDESCTFIDDDAGVEGAPEGVPKLALTEWWEYPDCVAMTGTPHLIRLDTGRLLKLEVLRYYGEGQDQCDTDGQIGADAAMIQLMWAFVH